MVPTSTPTEMGVFTQRLFSSSTPSSSAKRFRSGSDVRSSRTSPRYMNCNVPDQVSSLRTVLTAGMSPGSRFNRLLSSVIRLHSQPAMGSATT